MGEQGTAQGKARLAGAGKEGVKEMDAVTKRMTRQEYLKIGRRAARRQSDAELIWDALDCIETMPSFPADSQLKQNFDVRNDEALVCLRELAERYPRERGSLSG